MLESLLGSRSCERVLIFLAARGEGYPREIARFYDASYYPIQKQLEKLEAGGILVSSSKGRTRLYTLNPRYPFFKELKNLLDQALRFYPEAEQVALLVNRRRPRRRGKVL